MASVTQGCRETADAFGEPERVVKDDNFSHGPGA
jgi:hypothetical protein